MSGLLNPNLNSSGSNLPDSTRRPFTASFSGQSGSIPGFHHSGLHNMHGNCNLSNMPGSHAQRNAAISGLPSSGVQQVGGSMPGRFASNNLPVAMSQIPHAHSGAGGRGMNVGAGPAFCSSMSIGDTMQGLSSNLGSGGSRNSVPGMSISPALGNLGTRMTSPVGNIVGGSNVGRNISSGGLLVPGRNISSGGLSVPSIASRTNLSGNAGSGNLNFQGSNRMMNGLLQQASPQLMNMLGNSYPTSGGSLSQNQIEGGNKSYSSMGMLHDVSDATPFDINDFPQLTGRPSSAGGPQGQYGSLRKQGVGVSTIVQQNQEFSIQNEDFPALPGFKGNSSDYAMELHHKEQLHENVPAVQAHQYPPMVRSVGFNLGSSYPPNRQQHQQGTNSVQNAGLRPLSQTSSFGSYDQLLQQYQQPQTHIPFRLQQIMTNRDQSSSRELTPPDPYGLMGLLALHKIKDADADLSQLALGLNLTTLGLNLNSPDNLYKTFGSPWSNEPAKEDPDFHIPACYSTEPPLCLQPFLFQKFQTLTLFYIFYSMPKDEAQLYAANELYNRGWFYHKELEFWLMRFPNVEPLVKTPLYERGSYGCFDPNNWETVRKDNFVIHYDLIQKRPDLPSAAQNVR